MKGAWLGMLLVGMGIEAHAAGRLSEVQIIDRDTGSVLPMYRSRGEYWVAGRPGARYSIMIQNHRGERILAVTAVDGINVISGETGAWSQSGYVFGPGENYEIAGWRKSDAEIAAFNFTSSGSSYAARTGRPANVGVIGVALFLERPARVSQYESFDRRSEQGGFARNRIEAAAAADSATREGVATTAMRTWWRWAWCRRAPCGRRPIRFPIQPCRGMYRIPRAADNGVNEPVAGVR